VDEALKFPLSGNAARLLKIVGQQSKKSQAA